MLLKKKKKKQYYQEHNKNISKEQKQKFFMRITFFCPERFIYHNSPALIVLFPTNILPNKLALNIPNAIQRSPPSCSFMSISIV